MTGDRRKDFNNVLGTCMVVLFMLAGMIYLFVQGELGGMVMLAGVVGVLLMGAAAVWGILAYRDKYVSREEMGVPKVEKSVLKREQQLHKKIPGRDMYEVCKRYMSEFEVEKAVVIAIGVALFSIANLLQSGKGHFAGVRYVIDSGASVGRVALEIIIRFGPYILGPIIAGVAYYLYSRFGGKSAEIMRRFKSAVDRSGYDFEHVNLDFMSGTKHYLIDGLLCIGASYIVLCHKDVCFLCEMRDVKKAEKQMVLHTEKSAMMPSVQIEKHYAKIYTAKGNITVKPFDELGAEMIVKELGKHGIFDKAE